MRNVSLLTAITAAVVLNLCLRPLASDQRIGKASPLDVVIDQFEVKDAILRDAISQLTLEKIDGLHVGFEEIIRERIQDDPRALSPHFSLRLEKKRVGEIFQALCGADGRYAWSRDGGSINIYPVGTVGDASYLLNLSVSHIEITESPDPDQALTPLSKLFPQQQIGYFGPGLGNNTYNAPWTVAFDHLSVRQFVNRIAEHMGAQTSWVWEGGRDERMFTFLKGGFHTTRRDSQ